MAPFPQSLELTAHMDGYAVRFGGEVVDVFPEFFGAAAGLLAARKAHAELAACLARAPSNTDRKAA